MQPIKLVSESAEKCNFSQGNWVGQARWKEPTLAYVDLGGLCGLPPLLSLRPHPLNGSLALFPQLQETDSEVGPPWLGLGFASSLPCFGARLTPLLTWWAAENITRMEKLLGYFRKVLETIFARSSHRQLYPQQCSSPHGKIRFRITPLSPLHRSSI